MAKQKVDTETGEVVVRPRVYKEHTRRRPVVPKGTPRVKSEFKDQCDINRIVARIQKTGDMSALHLDRSWAEGDFTQIPTNYTDAFLLTQSVREKFMQVPAKERLAKYDNDPQRWIADLENQQKASREAYAAAQKAAAQEQADEAAYRKKRRESASAAPETGEVKEKRV